MKSNLLKFSLIALSLLPLKIVADSYNDYIYKYYFVNGMLNSRKQANDSLKIFRDIILYQYKTNPTYGSKDSLKRITSKNFDLSYNENEELIEQALEVYKQKVIDDTYTSDKDLSSYYTWSGFIDFLSKTEKIFKLSENDFNKKFFEEKMNNYIFDVYVNDDDLNTHIDNYRRDIKSGAKVILLAHSQGNFYANFAYDMLYRVAGTSFNTNSLGIVSAGTPAIRVKNNHNPSTAPYTTFDIDIPMLGVRTLFPDTLPANDTVSYNIIPLVDKCGGDPMCHGFIEAYTNILNKSRSTIMKNVINIAENLEKSQWKKVGEVVTKRSCDYRWIMENKNTGEREKVYPFNTESGRVYQVKHNNDWVLASYGGDMVYKPEYDEDNICYKLRKTKDVMRKDPSLECDTSGSSSASDWNIKIIDSTNATITHKIYGTKIENVYPFNRNGYVYQAGRDWVIGSCGGEEVHFISEDHVDEGYIKEYYKLFGTDETILTKFEYKNPQPTPTSNPNTGSGSTPTDSFNCNGTYLQEGEFEIEATECVIPYSNDLKIFYFWLEDSGINSTANEDSAIYSTTAVCPLKDNWQSYPYNEQCTYDTKLYPELFQLSIKARNNNIYCGEFDKDTIKKWGGNVHYNCSDTSYNSVYIRLDKKERRRLIGDNKDLCKEGSWEIIKEGDKSSCETNRVVVRNKDNGMILYGVYPFNENGAVYDLDEEFVLGSCGGVKILKDWDGKTEDECYKLEGVNDVIDTKVPFECIGDGRDYGLEIMATYCSYSGGDNGHFWLRDDGFVHIDSNQKGTFATDLAQKYQSCGVLSSSEIANLGGDSYCYEANVYWGEPTVLSRKVRKVQKVEPLNPNILDSMNDYNQTEYSKKLNQGKGKN